MDISEYTRIVFDKLHRFEPENATKIIGYLLLQDHGEQDMVKLASLPDHLIRDVAYKARTELQRLASRSAIQPISLPTNSQQCLSHLSVISPTSVITPGTLTSPASFQVQSPYWDPQSASNTNAEFMALGYVDSISELQKQTPLFSLENHMDTMNSGTAGIANDYYGLDASSASNLGGKNGRFEFPVKTCHYFNKGFCKHGNSCRYYHEQGAPDMFSHMYKKVLQADGYLTESQRHGKSGYSLTKLLARLKNSIRLIDSRPHGQHSVVLAEDAPKFNGKVDYGKYISASRQIYLTFPADSTFSEGDVSNYFSTFGKVEDVRIPSQERRMFGFVTFDDPETVKVILDKGNPHYVCESRVLVKPYKEKPKLMLRKNSDRIEHSAYYSPHYVDIDTEPTSIPRSCRKPRFLRRQLINQQEEAALEFQRQRFAELQLAQKSLSTSPHLGFNMDGLKVSDVSCIFHAEHFNVQSAEPHSHAPNDIAGYTDNNYTDEDSNQGLNLPDSPFAFPVDSGISAVM
ncbi:zinc finger CCCH domain-containing protein 18-like isoform X5 [Glycine soja]|uniref:zinc finger CCCH domain-containing protein 18-like isoform X5 n=1 Tax=Glycine soja TaxID=3848 RepID=UPI00103B0B06|nr:zinc finger CCCH domain-containing protein 18-like isoform X5 [Glycine soja]